MMPFVRKGMSKDWTTAFESQTTIPTYFYVEREAAVSGLPCKIHGRSGLRREEHSYTVFPLLIDSPHLPSC